jgi:anti-sigma factor ChrR (cupin superfamily)
MMYQGIAYVRPSTIVTAATFAGGLPTCPSICRAKPDRSISCPMPAKRAGAPVSSWPTQGGRAHRLTARRSGSAVRSRRKRDGHRPGSSGPVAALHPARPDAARL